jgi:hypothetical protein
MSEQSESNESQSKVREVFIVKRSTKIDSDEYVSVQLKSSDDSIEKLLKKAVLASVLNTPQKSVTTKGVQLTFFLFYFKIKNF